MLTIHKLELIGRVAHEANRAYCESLGDSSQLPWKDAPQWQRDSAYEGIRRIAENPNTSPSASHDVWLAQKLADGWAYGPEKRPELKQHPCIVPFEELPVEQKAKDYIFTAVVKAML